MRGRTDRSRASLAAPIAVAAALMLAGSAQARFVPVDRFTLATPPAAPGQIDLVTLSAPPGAVSGGDVLVEVRGLQPGDRLVVRRNGRRVTRAFEPAGTPARRGLIAGLRSGRNAIEAVARRAGRGTPRTVRLAVRNHPLSGPVISGPQQQPFVCETERAGLGPPRGPGCSAPTRVEWRYRSIDGSYKPLGDPGGAYPRDVTRTRTASGRVVPFVVRIETTTINRGITRIAVLDDPRARGAGASFVPALWNRRMTYVFGQGCGVGYHQGTTSLDELLGPTPRLGREGLKLEYFTSLGLPARLGAGDMIVRSSTSSFGVQCNPLVSAETLMMVKEHVTERYGRPERTVGLGGSGGAMQQLNAADNYPGLLDGSLATLSFPDVTTMSRTILDCGLMTRYFASTRVPWADGQRAAVAGHAVSDICRDWTRGFLKIFDPQRGCDRAIPADIRYQPAARPRGARCTQQDATVNTWGRDAATGFANRPFDNVGVQYGLAALNAGRIDLGRFIDLNRRIGGYDLDLRPTAQRSAASPRTAQRAYQLGAIVGRGALSQTPTIDLALYVDPISPLGIHDVVRAFQTRARLRARSPARSSASYQIWRGLAAPEDARPALDRWLEAIERGRGAGDRTALVASTRPAAAGDRCIVTALGTRLEAYGGLLGPFGLTIPLAGVGLGRPIPIGLARAERQEASGGGCQGLFPARSGPRPTAGGPLADDVLKCQLKPVDARDYRVRITPAQLGELRRIFSQGVCDWSKPGVGEAAPLPWASLGGRKLSAPRTVQWSAARSSRP